MVQNRAGMAGSGEGLQFLAFLLGSHRKRVRTGSPVAPLKGILNSAGGSYPSTLKQTSQRPHLADTIMQRLQFQRESVCVHVCVHECFCVCLCLCVCICMCSSVWRYTEARRQLQISFLNLVILRSLFLWNSPGRLSWLARVPGICLSLDLPGSEVTNRHYHTSLTYYYFLMWVLGIELRSSCLQSKPFADRAILQLNMSFLFPQLVPKHLISSCLFLKAPLRESCF